MHADTRQRLMDAAEQLFADKGFYGVSIAAVANEVGLTKQGILHYFNSKEKLYGAILQRISDDFEEQQRLAGLSSGDPVERLRELYETLAAPSETNTRRTRLLVRELLDNNVRAKRAENWYLQSFLEHSIGMVKQIDNLQTLSSEQALIFCYQILGAINYFLISPATLRGIFGEEIYESISTNFLEELDLLIAARVNLGNKGSSGEI
jgi:AcrR family transcriptional regulator